MSKTKSMSLILELIALGLARLEKSKTSDLVEICFRGIRYPCTDRDWTALVRTIGYKNIEACIALEKNEQT